MTPRNTFDEQLREWMQDVPPVHPNLGVTILETTRQTPQSGRTWWASTRTLSRMVAATAVIAVITLFGGVVLLGLLASEEEPREPGTTSSPTATIAPSAAPTSDPSPLPRPSIPPSAELGVFERTLAASTLEDLGPGLERISADGTGADFIDWRSSFADAQDGATRLVAGPEFSDEGSAWLGTVPARGAGRLARLGAGSIPALDSPLDINDQGLWLRSAPDESVWVGGGNDVSHYDGTSWYWPDTEYVSDVQAVEVAADGAAWIAWRRDNELRASRLGEVTRNGWREHETDIATLLGVERQALLFGDIAALRDGGVRVLIDVLGGSADAPARTLTAEYRDGDWTSIAASPMVADAHAVELATAPDGAVWTYHERAASEEAPASGVLTREAEGQVVVADGGVGLPPVRERSQGDPPRDRLQVGPDGTVWMETRDGPLASFDGTSWATRGIDGVDTYDIAPDGSALVLDREGRLVRIEAGGEPLTSATEAPAAPDQSAVAPGLPPGFVAEELVPGVYRIDSDGVRELVSPAGSQERRHLYSSVIVAGRDDSIWSFGPDEYYRLGDERTYRWAETSPSYGEPPVPGEVRDRAAGHVVEPSSGHDIEVAADGTVWYALGFPAPWVYEGERRHGLWRFDGEVWLPGGLADVVVAVELAADGSVWAQRLSGQIFESEAFTVHRSADGGEWQAIGSELEPAEAEDAVVDRGLYVIDDGEAWLALGGAFQLEAGEWQQMEVPELGSDPAYFAVGDDGTIWLAYEVSYGNSGSDVIARYEAGAWITFEEDTIPERGNGRFQIPHKVGPDGALWLPLKGDRECGGIGRFDGEAWQTYLPGTCIYAFDIGSDGRVWIRGGAIRWNAAGDDLLAVRPIETYLVDPSFEER